MESPIRAFLDSDALLIETFGWWQDNGIRHWPMHRQRLSASAHAFGRTLPEAELDALPERISATVAEHGGQFLESPATPNDASPTSVDNSARHSETVGCRCRLTLDRQGQLDLDLSALPPAVSHWQLGLSAVVLESANPWLAHKSSHRPWYEEARQHMPAELDEVLLLNERGELADGSISNLFIQQGATWLTPSRDCGLLPGVLRESLIANGSVQEAVLTPADLSSADAILMGNSLRGLIPCRFVDA